MEYLIDSDASIDYLHLDPEATAWVESLIPAGVAISIVTLMESYQGTFREPDPIASQEHYAEYLRGIPVLPFSERSTKRCANLRHELWKQGKRVRPRALDMMIAAAAMEHGLTLVTRNRSDYQDIPGLNLAQQPPN